MIQLKIDVYNNPSSYLHQHWNGNFKPESLWNEFWLKYKKPGQYDDNDLMMATIKATNIDIQLYGGSNILHFVENSLSKVTPDKNQVSRPK